LKKIKTLSFDDFTGQDQVQKILKFCWCCKLRSEALDHTLFHGPPGLAKPTLANILAK
jgi:Holliday junction DNA helicase RuvB